MAHPPERAHRNDLEHGRHDEAAAPPREQGRPPDLGRAAAAVSQLQLRTSSGQMVMTDDASKREQAAEGFAGGGGALPHLDRIQASFGAGHDLSGVRAHVGGQAAAASKALGAEGFASGNQVAFKSTPDLHLAAHEAAHVVQQQGGVQLKGGVGQASDVHERHADAVADRVVAGQSAADLLPDSKSAGNEDAVQLYTEEVLGGSGQWRVSESGESALKQDGKNQTLYASEGMIADANSKLAGAGQNGSFITLGKSGKTMEVKGKELHHVAPKMKPTGSDGDNKLLSDANKPGGKDAEGKKGDTMALWSDCGRSSRAVMGTDDAGKSPHAEFNIGKDAYRTKDGTNPAAYSATIYYHAMKAYLKDKANHAHSKKGVHYTGDLEGEWQAVEPTSADHARELYWELGDVGRRAFDQYAKINTAANPEVGGAYTMNTEYDMPGSDVVKEEDGTNRMRWNFHWGGVVMKDGGNNVTLENYAIMFEETGDAAKDAANAEKAYDWTNRSWNYQMYGTVKEGQSFHEQHLETGTHGTRASTFAAKVD